MFTCFGGKTHSKSSIKNIKSSIKKKEPIHIVHEPQIVSNNVVLTKELYYNLIDENKKLRRAYHDYYDKTKQLAYECRRLMEDNRNLREINAILRNNNKALKNKIYAKENINAHISIENKPLPANLDIPKMTSTVSSYKKVQQDMNLLRTFSSNSLEYTI